jgi:hypothetical protein
MTFFSTCECLTEEVEGTWEEVDSRVGRMLALYGGLEGLSP